MPVDHIEVRRIVNEAIADAPYDGSCCDRLKQAFRELQRRRQAPGGSLDLDLAAAEHHLFARWMVCAGEVSPVQMRTLVDGYDTKKRWDAYRGNPDAVAVTDNPVSPPDDDVRAWGLRGVTEGEADHKRCNAAVTPPLWRSVTGILGRGAGPY